jgi:dihydrofolate synthase / folylpolyglutamate synthase
MTNQSRKSHVTPGPHIPHISSLPRQASYRPEHLPPPENAFAYLASLDSMGIRLGLDELRRLLEKLNNPHLAYPSILIGGTNGKGSVAAMTASILIQSGYRVGLYTSPHLVDFSERIRVNNRMISQKQMIACIDRVRRCTAEPVTWFEFVTAMAFLHFAKQHVDIAVLEVGMGGRLDATNVTDPIVSVITNISHEHTAYLGSRLSQIGKEKGAIIRENQPCITAAKQPQVIHLLEKMCLDKRAALYRLGEDFQVRKNRDGTLRYQGLKKIYPRLICPLQGRHQYDNTGAALAAIEALAEKGFKITDETVLEGMRRVRWEGRLEILQKNPLVLLDGAHNPAGIAALCRTLQNDYRNRRLIVIFGVLSDKDTARMLKPLCRLAHRIILTEPDVSRALSSDILFSVAKRYHHHVAMAANPSEALGAALDSAGASDLICITGSLYLVGEIKKAFPFQGDYDKRKQR